VTAPVEDDEQDHEPSPSPVDAGARLGVLQRWSPLRWATWLYVFSGLLEELVVLIDVSHVGRAGVEHILELATKPVVASHSSAFALRDHHRNLTDEQLRGIAATGGVVCVNFFAGFLTTAEKPTVDHLADHILHILDIAGEDHVGLGSDFVAEVFGEKIPACDRPVIIQGLDAELYVPGLEGPAGMPLVTDALLRRGLPEATIRKILGENLTRILTTDGNL